MHLASRFEISKQASSLYGKRYFDIHLYRTGKLHNKEAGLFLLNSNTFSRAALVGGDQPCKFLGSRFDRKNDYPTTRIPLWVTTRNYVLQRFCFIENKNENSQKYEPITERGLELRAYVRNFVLPDDQLIIFLSKFY